MNQQLKGPVTVGDLVGSLAAQTGTLLRQELHLASREMGVKARMAALDIGAVLVGGALIHAGLVAVGFGIVIALAAFIPTWISALIIGLATLVVGFAVASRGIKALRGLDPLPQKTLHTLADDRRFLKEQLR